MLVVDANVLVYAVNADSAQHEPARRFLESALSASEPVGLPWTVLLAFLRIVTHPGILPRPVPVDHALSFIEEWLARPCVVVVEPSPRHAAILTGLLRATGTGGNLVGDAHLAAIAFEYGGTIVSFDRDFGRFAGLRTRVPA